MSRSDLKRRLIRKLIVPGTVPFVLALAACVATGSPEMDARFGERLRLLQEQQRVDPDATVNNAQTNPLTDGRTVREASERHVDGYRNPSTSNVVGGTR